MKNEYSNIENRISKLESTIKQKENKNSIIEIAMILFFCMCVVMIGAYISFLLGFDYFIIPPNHNYSDTITAIVSILLFTANMLFLFSTALNLQYKKTIAVVVLYLPIYFISVLLFGDSLISSALLPVVYVLVISAINKRILKSIKNITIYIIATSIYQYLSLIVKTKVFDIGMNQMDPIRMILYSIDLFIFYGTVKILIGGTEYVQSNRLALELPFRSVSQEHDSTDRQSDEIRQHIEKLPQNKKVVFAILFYAIQMLQLVLVALVCTFIGNTPIELIILFVGYIGGWKIWKKRWHSNNVFHCTIISTSLFYIASRASIPAIYSQFIPIIIGMAIAYGLFIVYQYSEDYNRMKAICCFRIETCNEEEFRAFVAKTKCIKKQHVELMLDIFVNDVEMKDAAEKHTYGYDYVRKLKRDYERKIESIVNKK